MTRFQRFKPVFALVAGVYVATILAGSAVGIHWARADAAPSVRVLGSGARLSILVTSSRARVLIATGDDASDFGNAIAHALSPTGRRIDLLILAGSERDLAVASAAVRNLNARSTWILAGPLVAHADELGLSTSQVIATATTVTLADDFTIRVEPASAQDGGWLATINHRNVAIRAGTAELLATGDNHAATIISVAGKIRASTPLGHAGAVVVPSSAMNYADLAALADGSGKPRFALRVSPGDAVRLDFRAAGIELPDGAREVKCGLPARLGCRDGLAGFERRLKLSLNVAEHVRVQQQVDPVNAIALATSKVLAKPISEIEASTTSCECQVQTRLMIG